MWRCGNCNDSIVLGVYTDLGGFYIRNKRGRAMHYVLNLRNFLNDMGVQAHCTACHDWRELYYDHTARAVKERRYRGFTPVIGCTCNPRGHRGNG